MANKAYSNDLLEHNADRLQHLTAHFLYAEKELSMTGATRQLLWNEYILEHPDGYLYSHYRYHLVMATQAEGA